MHLAEAGYLVTFGIRPDYPETGYGYIEGADRVSEDALSIRRFVEKPNKKTGSFLPVKIPNAAKNPKNIAATVPNFRISFLSVEFELTAPISFFFPLRLFFF